MTRCVRIANGCGFWGDDPDAPANLLRQCPDLDFLTLDYLAEVSMSILANQMQRHPDLGFAYDFLDALRSIAGNSRCRIVTNAGGLNPLACARACAKILPGVRIAAIVGDDVLGQIRAEPNDPLYRHMETGRPISEIADRLTSASAYLGAAPIVAALKAGSQIVITGRVADPSLTVGPAAFAFGWELNDYARIAGATVAGHLIECGAQATGGISTDWLAIPDPAHIGFPIAEIHEDGSCVITKPPGTGGCVSVDTIEEQLVYEIGDPSAYLSPDATVSLLGLAVRQEAPDRVEVRGAIGSAPPVNYKVSATYRDGYRATGMLTIFGRDAVAKARGCGEIVMQRMKDAGCTPRRSNIECIGAGDVAPGAVQDSREVVLRISVADDRKEVITRFQRMLAPLVTGGPPGTTGYADASRPAIHEAFGYWPCLIPRQRVVTKMEIVEA